MKKKQIKIFAIPVQMKWNWTTLVGRLTHDEFLLSLYDKQMMLIFFFTHFLFLSIRLLFNIDLKWKIKCSNKLNAKRLFLILENLRLRMVEKARKKIYLKL